MRALRMLSNWLLEMIACRRLHNKLRAREPHMVPLGLGIWIGYYGLERKLGKHWEVWVKLQAVK